MHSPLSLYEAIIANRGTQNYKYSEGKCYTWIFIMIYFSHMHACYKKSLLLLKLTLSGCLTNESSFLQYNLDLLSHFIT